MQIDTAEQYYAAVQRIDHDRREAFIDSIPLNVNRAGKHFRKLIKDYDSKTKRRGSSPKG